MQTSTGFTALGADTIPPLVARGVLLDVAGALGRRAAARRPRDHRRGAASAAAEGVELRRGRRRARAARLGRGLGRPAGLRGGRRRVAARRRRGWPRASRCSSAPTTSPGTCPASSTRDTGTTLPGHVHLLVRGGIYIVESLNLEALAADGVREFAFVCLPLKLRGGTGSPVRPLALAERAARS